MTTKSQHVHSALVSCLYYKWRYIVNLFSRNPYSKLVKGREKPRVLTKAALKRLSRAIFKRNGVPNNIPIGYTYLGQFIAHEIVPSTNILPGKPTTPHMDLDSLYSVLADSYDKHFDSDGRFLLSADGGDVLRDRRGPLIGDLRNDENVIVSQLHLFWQKVHNKFIGLILKKPITKKGEPALCLAKKLTIRVFQKIVIHDYLKRILDRDVYEYYVSSAAKPVLINEKMSSIPYEFSHAVFRFGHSMVRSAYRLQRNGEEQQTKDLLRKDRSKPLLPSHRVEMDFIFSDSGEKAMRIDAAITNAMSQAPGKKAEFLDIVEVNVAAGYKAGLIAGIRLLQYICENHNDLAQSISLLNRKEHKLDRIRKLIELLELYMAPEDLPLWLFTLMEAELIPANDNLQRDSRDDTGPGWRLGPLASLIVTEVILSSIDSSTLSSSNLISVDRLLSELYEGSYSYEMLSLIEFLENYDEHN